MRLSPAQFAPEFVSSQMASAYGKAYFLAHAKQTTGIATINQRVLAAFPLMAPPLADQKRTAALISDQGAKADRLRAAAEAQLASAQALPTVLLRRAFQGEI